MRVIHLHLHQIHPPLCQTYINPPDSTPKAVIFHSRTSPVGIHVAPFAFTPTASIADDRAVLLLRYTHPLLSGLFRPIESFTSYQTYSDPVQTPRNPTTKASSFHKRNSAIGGFTLHGWLHHHSHHIHPTSEKTCSGLYQAPRFNAGGMLYFRERNSSK